MKYKLLGKTGLRVSEICLGTMTFGEEWGWGASKETCKELFSTFLNEGGNFIDTANYYTNGASESILGELIQGTRQQLVIATKYSLMMNQKDINSGGNNRKNMIQSVEQSLKRLKTDYIDLFWVHIWDALTPIDETIRGLEDLIKSGKILYTGISDTPAWVIAKANAVATSRSWNSFSAVQLEYNLLERTGERELIPMAHHEDLSILAWSPLAGGLLSGKYNSSAKKENDDARLGTMSSRLTSKNLQIADTVIEVAKEKNISPATVALLWVKSQKNVIPVIGARKIEQLRSNLECLYQPLNPEELKKLNEASHIPLGFPMDFINSKGVKEIVYGNFKITST